MGASVPASPASDCWMPLMSRKLCEPGSTYWPGSPRSSEAAWIMPNSSGAHWASSTIRRWGLLRTNPTGSSRAAPSRGPVPRASATCGR